MATNLKNCGSTPILPSTTPYPKAQAFLVSNSTLKKGKKGKDDEQDLKKDSISSNSLRLNQSLMQGSTIELAQRFGRENNRLRNDLFAVNEKNSELKQMNEALKRQVEELTREAVVRNKIVNDIEAAAMKTNVRNDRLVKALAALSVDQQGLDSTSTELSRVEDDLLLGANQKRKKIDWGGSNDTMFKQALSALARERNEISQQASKLERQLQASKRSYEQLERKYKELKFTKQYAQGGAGYLSPVANGQNSNLSDVPLGVKPKLQDLKQDSVGKIEKTPKPLNASEQVEEVVTKAKNTAHQDAFTNFQLLDPSLNSTTELFHAAMDKLGIPISTFSEEELDNEEEDEDEDDSHDEHGGEHRKTNRKEIERESDVKLTRSQARAAINMIQSFHESAVQVFRLTEEEYSDLIRPMDLFAKISQVCTKIAPGAKHVTLWIVDRERKEIWTRNHRRGREIRFPYDQGIAGHVAQTGENIVLNNCILESNMHGYNPKIDHLGSSREFYDPRNKRDKFQRQSLATIPLFSKCWGTSEDAYNVPSEEDQQHKQSMPCAIIQISKSASKMNEVRKRVFSDIEPLLLSQYGHSALWILQHTIKMAALQSRDLAMQHMLQFPVHVTKSLTVPINERKTEQAKVEFLVCLEKQAIKALQTAKRCRVFAVSNNVSSNKPMLLWAPSKKNYEFDVDDDDWESKERSTCVANSGVAGYCATNREHVFLQTPYNDSRFNANIDLESDGLSLVTAPIFSVKNDQKQTLIGVVQVSFPYIAQTKDQTVQKVVQELAPQLAITIALTNINIGQK